MKALLLVMPFLFLGGCTALTEEGKAQRQALTDYHYAKDKVNFQTLKLGISTTKVATATIEMIKDAKDLSDAKSELDKAKERLHEQVCTR